MAGGWGFSDDHFDAAYGAWKLKFQPSDEKNDSLINWALGVVREGQPPDGHAYIDPDTLLVAAIPDTFTYCIPGIDVVIKYLLVPEKESIVVHEFWG